MAIEAQSEDPRDLRQWTKEAAPQLCPTGMLAPFVGVPDFAWEKADGRVLLRTAYRALYLAIGTAYNVGGETVLQFRLPNITVGGLSWYIKS
jgi:hypothetical protein